MANKRLRENKRVLSTTKRRECPKVTIPRKRQKVHSLPRKELQVCKRKKQVLVAKRRKCQVIYCQCNGSSLNNYKAKLRSHSKLRLPGNCGPSTCSDCMCTREKQTDAVKRRETSTSWSSSSSESEYITYRVKTRTKTRVTRRPLPVRRSPEKRAYKRKCVRDTTADSSSSTSTDAESDFVTPRKIPRLEIKPRQKVQAKKRVLNKRRPKVVKTSDESNVDSSDRHASPNVPTKGEEISTNILPSTSEYNVPTSGESIQGNNDVASTSKVVKKSASTGQNIITNNVTSTIMTRSSVKKSGIPLLPSADISSVKPQLSNGTAATSSSDGGNKTVVSRKNSNTSNVSSRVTRQSETVTEEVSGLPSGNGFAEKVTSSTADQVKKAVSVEVGNNEHCFIRPQNVKTRRIDSVSKSTTTGTPATPSTNFTSTSTQIGMQSASEVRKEDIYNTNKKILEGNSTVVPHEAQSSNSKCAEWLTNQPPFEFKETEPVGDIYKTSKEYSKVESNSKSCSNWNKFDPNAAKLYSSTVGLPPPPSNNTLSALELQPSISGVNKTVTVDGLNNRCNQESSKQTFNPLQATNQVPRYSVNNGSVPNFPTAPLTGSTHPGDNGNDLTSTSGLEKVTTNSGICKINAVYVKQENKSLISSSQQELMNNTVTSSTMSNSNITCDEMESKVPTNELEQLDTLTYTRSILPSGESDLSKTTETPDPEPDDSSNVAKKSEDTDAKPCTNASGFFFGTEARLETGELRAAPPAVADKTDPTVAFGVNIFNQWVREQELEAKEKETTGE